MKRKFQFALTLFFSFFFLLAADAKTSRQQTVKYECPNKLKAGVSQAPNPWTLLDEEKSDQDGDFKNVGVYDGHPREMASLVPDVDNSPPKPSTWKLDSVSQKYWLACSYKNTKAQYGFNLPAGISECSSFHRKGKGGFICLPRVFKKSG